MSDYFKNKTILVTGGTGSIGSALVRELLKYGPKQVRVFSRDQNKQFDLIEDLEHPANLRLLVGDVREEKRLDLAFENVDIIIHAAALKHVPLSEYNPFEVVKTNIIGSQNVIDMARKHNIKKVIAISTDKAVNPTSVMGTSKLMMEKLMLNANQYHGKTKTKFACVRFGNVAWSTSSVLHVWKKQLVNDGKIKITNPDMTRFLMSRDQAASLVLKATESAVGGEIFVLKMPAIKLRDLASVFASKYGGGKKVEFITTGNRAGEKKHEELFLTHDAEQQTFENQNMFIVIPRLIDYTNFKPRTYPGFKKINNNNARLTSNKNIDIEAIKKII